MELDRLEINELLDWSGASVGSICRFVKSIPVASNVKVGEFLVYNRGKVVLEDTRRRPRECWMISIWTERIGSPNAECLFQQPVPIKIRLG